ncbi:MAG TPA: GNAT family N-acetyltransferase, partial [Vulgatibacter sp.]
TGSWQNYAVGLGLDGPVHGRDLDRVVAFYRDRGVAPTVEVSPFAHESLIHGLAERGFALREFETVLARTIAPREDLRPSSWPQGLEIVDVDPRDDEQVRTFIDVSTSGFRPEGHPLDGANEVLSRRMVEHPRSRAFLALVDGVAAGGGAVEIGEDVACLFGTSVLPAFRRRGIQQALILRRLERCREEGSSLAVIHSIPGAATDRNALRLGFTLAYTRVVLYQRPPEQPRID